MTDQEINEAVAKKLGWKKFDQHYQYWIPPTIELVHKYGDTPSHLPLYTKSIEAAWEIIQKIAEEAERKGGGSILSIEHDGLWHCRLRFDIVAQAKTASMAICLAFLKIKD